MSAALPDRAARERAVREFEANLVVVAGAGTGKTSLLVERVLNLVLSGRAALTDVLAITFTEKAAGEMRERVAEALDAVMAGGGKDGDEAARSLAWLRGPAGVAEAEIRERAQAALEVLDAAPISTIHSYCSDLLRRYPDRADLPPEFSVDEGLGQELLFDELWPDFLAEELGASASREPLWRRVLDAFGEEEIETIARALALAGGAADSLAAEGYRPLDLRAVFGPRAEALVALLTAARGEIKVRANGKMPDFLESLITLLRAFRAGGAEGLQAVPPEKLALTGFWDSKGGYSAGTERQLGPRKAEIEGAADEAHKLVKSLREADEAEIAALLDALRPFAADFRRRARRDGVLAYEDLLILARDLLRDRPEVRREEAERIRTILVDEFQDTDPIQYEIVFLLAARDRSSRVTDPFALELEPARLFIVGDPKQSIYRFRGADMAAFVRATDLVRGADDPLSLVTNFRSVPEVVEPVNRLFESWIGPADESERDVEPQYERIESHRDPAGDGARVDLWSVIAPEGTHVHERREAEGREIAREILRLCEPGAGGEAPCAFRDIAILLRSLNNVVAYTRELREAGIDFVIGGGKAFTERPEVVEALALLEALANPADPVAALAMLRSAFGGVDDGALAAYARDGGRFYWPGALSEEDAARHPLVASAFARLKQLDHDTRMMPVDRRVQAVLTEGEFLLAQCAFADGGQRVANVRKLAERTAGLARDRGLTLEEAILHLRDEFTGNRNEAESPLADEAVNAVRILTIHKAKGLEYPVVFIPDLGRQKPQERTETSVSLFRLRDQIGIALTSGSRRDRRRRNAAALLAREENRRHEAAEEKRLLYVAATRARDRLILVNSAVTRLPAWVNALQKHWGYVIDKDDQAHPFVANGDALLDGAVLHREIVSGERAPGAGKAAERDVAASAAAFREAAQRAAAAAAVRRRTPSADRRAETVERAADDADGPAARRRELARAVGLAVHAALERTDFGRPASASAALAATAAAAAREIGCPPGEVLAAATKALRGLLGSPTLARLAEAEILGREVPILFRDADGMTVHGYADLIYRMEGRVIVADYKTDEGAAAEAAERYRDQLADYAAAIRVALGLAEPPATELILVRTGERVEL